MNITAILFDLDGTLLPMDQDLFMGTYLKMLGAKLADYGYEPNKLMKSVVAGTDAMVNNDGSDTNENVFWNRFKELLGDEILDHKPVFEEFYLNDFGKLREYCEFNEKAAKTVRTLKEKGFRVILATNPFFPQIATQQRIRWTGLEPEEFEIYTTYEDTYYCKPNLNYYRSIMKQLDLKPEECIMVGNDAYDDMIAAELGMQVFLLDDCLMNKRNVDITPYEKGSFDEFIDFVTSVCNK